MIPRWGPYVARRLDELARGEGDFTGLQQPSPETIRKAMYIIGDVLQPTTSTPTIVPGREGQVLLVWHKHGWVLEVSIHEVRTQAWAYQAATGATWSGPMAEVQPLVALLLKDLED